MEQQGILWAFIRERARGRLVLVWRAETGDVPERRSPALPRGAAASSRSGLRTEQEGGQVEARLQKGHPADPPLTEGAGLAQTGRSAQQSQDIKPKTAAQPRDAAILDLNEDI